MNWPWRRKTVVLGAELAAAQRAEGERLASGIPIPSPLHNHRYDFENGDYNLVAVSSLQIDLKLLGFTKDFRDLNSPQRDEIARQLSFDDLYTLIHFVKRAAVLALNRDSFEWCRAGLVALSMLDKTRIDARDAWWSAGLLRHAINTAPAITEELSEEVARNGFSHIAGLLTDSLEPSKLSDWGYVELRTTNGVGLIKHGGKRYEPSIDLTTTAIKISEARAMSRYVADVEIATDLAEIWFAKNSRDDAGVTLSRARATASIHGALRKDYYCENNQMFIAWIVEMPASRDCEQLLSDVGMGICKSGRFVVGTSVDRWFALLVAGSWQEGVKPYESQETLTSIGEQIRELLNVAKGDEH
jgi:hypothetical protein